MMVVIMTGLYCHCVNNNKVLQHYRIIYMIVNYHNITIIVRTTKISVDIITTKETIKNEQNVEKHKTCIKQYFVPSGSF